MNAPNGSEIRIPPDEGAMWQRFTTCDVSYTMSLSAVWTSPTWPNGITTESIQTIDYAWSTTQTQTLENVSQSPVGSALYSTLLSIPPQWTHSLHEMDVVLRVAPTTLASNLVETENFVNPPGGSGTSYSNVNNYSLEPRFPFIQRWNDADCPAGQIGLDLDRKGYAGFGGGPLVSAPGPVLENEIKECDYRALLEGNVVTITITTTWPTASQPNLVGSATETITIQLS